MSCFTAILVRVRVFGAEKRRRRTNDDRVTDQVRGAGRAAESAGAGEGLRRQSGRRGDALARLGAGAAQQSRNYWITSTQPDGRPHACPVWGIWLEDDLFCFGTSRKSRKGKNLVANPAVVVHAESGDDVVILEGIVEELTDRGLLQKYADAYDAKYAIVPETDQGADSDGVTYVLRPDEVLAWTEHNFLKTPTRWRFDRQ